MKKIIASCDFTIGENYYIKGEEIKNLKYEDIVKLNEKGFIEPLDFKELMLIKRELEKAKEENDYGSAL